jgi:AraC-like DNA-binding protein
MQRAGGRTHRAIQHRSACAGVEAISVASDRAFPRHAHDEYGVGLMSAGGHRTCSRIGPVEAGAGDVVTINPGEMHDGASPDGRPRAWRMLYFPPALVARELGPEMAGEVEITRPALRDPVLAALFERLFRQVTATRPERLALEEDLLRLLTGVFRRYGARTPPGAGVSPCVRKALERLDAAPESPTSLAELATLSGVSRFQLLRGFAREVGTTPHAYLVQLRIRLARRLLAAGESPAEAAIAAGFADQSHLTRAFVRQLGVTPARYRAAVA